MAAFPGIDMQQFYGLTECSPYLSTLDQAAHRQALDGDEQILSSAGRPLPGTDLRILDDTGNEVPCGQSGEIVVRGPQITKGYHNRPQEQAVAYRRHGPAG
jgi:acyl-CoA synthetase (AMP-forming)/AMP-acid ligase II